MDCARREVTIREAVSLTTTEFDLLRCFLRYPGQVLSRDALMDMLRGGYAAYDRSIDACEEPAPRSRKRAHPDTSRRSGARAMLDRDPARDQT
jgi:DNA-binding response OmpR family regulator